MTNCEVGSEADIESDGEIDAQVKLHGLAGMGDVIGKILEKSIPSNTNVILYKSKKSRKRKLEIKKEHDEQKEKIEKKAESREMHHVVPTRGNAQKEILLKRVATRGVVKLLNAVSTHQKLVSEKTKEERTEAGKCKAAEKVTKSDFMELLRKKPSEKQRRKKVSEDEIKDEVKEEEEESSTNKKWDVLREDFMIGSSFKDWDKIQSENENENESDDDDDDDDDASSSDDEKG